MNLTRLWSFFRKPSLEAATPTGTRPFLETSELLARADAFNAAAEQQWRFIAGDPSGRRTVLGKPLTTVQEAGPMLYRLGLALSELRLGIGHTVLDLGAGSCWLSAYLNRLQCRTVSVDISQTALDLGREFFTLDARQRMDLEPRFLRYDGHTLPIGDESVDRMVCFDAFHHIPNQDEMLREIHRVLKTGGRAVLAEPGEGHSHMDQSVYEMERFGVLENDLNFEDLIARARAAGFTGAFAKPYPGPDSLLLTAESFSLFMRGQDSLYPLDELRKSLRHFLVIILTKGEESWDSRCPRLLRAEIAVSPAAVSGSAGALTHVEVDLKNSGDTLWLSEENPIGGYVALRAHLFGKDGILPDAEILGADLPRDIGPGESVRVELPVILPRAPGRYALRLDLVDEGIGWFEQRGSKTCDLQIDVLSYSDSRAPHRLLAEIEALETTSEAAPGGPLRFVFQLHNTADTTWLSSPPLAHGSVALGGHLFQGGTLQEPDFCRVALPRDVEPGETLRFAIEVPAPPLPGPYEIAFDLLSIGVSWFEHYGSRPLRAEIRVRDEVPDSRAPGLLRAEIEIRPREVQAARAESLTVEAHVSNRGNTRWLNEVPSGPGQVNLGARLLSRQGEVLVADFLRVNLPRTLAPGEEASFPCMFRAPDEPGEYVLEFDLVNEGLCWFHQRGSPTCRTYIKCT